jgi:predicted nucleic acid-binding protein
VDKIVIDCGVAIKWLTGGTYSEQARTILNRYRAETLTLLAPDFIRIEVANVLWNLQRLAGLTRETGRRAFEEFLMSEIAYTSAEELLTDAYNLALQHERSVYDSLYLALSVREQCQLVTAGERLYNAISKAMTNVVLLANWS